MATLGLVNEAIAYLEANPRAAQAQVINPLSEDVLRTCFMHVCSEGNAGMALDTRHFKPGKEITPWARKHVRMVMDELVTFMHLMLAVPVRRTDDEGNAYVDQPLRDIMGADVNLASLADEANWDINKFLPASWPADLKSRIRTMVELQDRKSVV